MARRDRGTSTVADVPGVRDGERRFKFALAVIALAGLIVRVTYVLVAKRHEPLMGDAVIFTQEGYALAHGLGFINPVLYYFGHGVKQANADHPPGLIVFLAAFNLMGIETPLGQRLAIAVVGGATIVLAGVIGRTIAGPRVGLVAALLAGFAPGVWVNDGQVLSEGPGLIVLALAVLLAVSFAREPSWKRGAAFGAATGLAALMRSEVGLLLPLIALPVAVGLRAARRRALTVFGAALGAFLLTISPWVIRNLTTFEHPIVFSSGFDITLENTNCDVTYGGELVGWWSPKCIRGRGGPQASVDESIRAEKSRDAGLTYIGDHLGRFPLVAAARLGRMWGVYRPGQTAQLMEGDGREKAIGLIDAISLWALVPLSIAGLVVLRRRRVPLSPLLAPIVVAMVACVLAFGNPRYRTAAEISLCVLPAIAVDAVLTTRATRRAATAEVN
jgi:4-amino-4-deoxy-L-arabinose transferase-like glycosyltransferase